MKKYVLGLDVGSRKCSAIVVDSIGSVFGVGSSNLESFTSPKPGWAEQNPEDWWNAICKSIKSAIASSKIKSEDIAAVGISAQRRTFVVLDENSKLLRPAILWLDNRAPHSMELRIRWLEENEIASYKKIHKILGVHAWLAHRLTGLWVDSKAAQFASEFQNAHTWDWDREILDENGIPSELLPELVTPGEVLGHIRKSVEKQVGLPTGLPVVAGSGDAQSGTIGAGCFGSNKLLINFGTAMTIGSTSKRRPSYPIMSEFSGIPHSYDAQFGMSGGLLLNEWFINNFQQVAAGTEKPSFEILYEEAAKIPPGSQGLCVLPHWWSGRWRQVIPHSDERGVTIGWRGYHTGTHFFRAIIEGIVQEARTYKELMERHLETSFTDIRVGNRGAESVLVMQITADVLGQRVSKTQTSEVSALGAAMTAAKGGGLHESVQDAVAKMARITATFEPIPKNQEFYDRLYRHVYKKLYWTAKDINTTLDELVFDI